MAVLKNTHKLLLIDGGRGLDERSLMQNEDHIRSFLS